jgi:hypothetical protein
MAHVAGWNPSGSDTDPNDSAGRAAAAADLDQDGMVAASDLWLFSSQWLARGPLLVADIYPDGFVNLADSAALARGWRGAVPPVAAPAISGE